MGTHPFARHMRALRGKRPIRQLSPSNIRLIFGFENYPRWRQDGSLIQPTRAQLEEVARIYGVSADALQVMLLPDGTRDPWVVEQERRSAMSAKFNRVCTQRWPSPCRKYDIPSHCELCGWDSARAMAEIESEES